MALTLLIIACFLLYLPSRYFPVSENIHMKIGKQRIKIMSGAVMLLMLSLTAFTWTYDGLTAFTVWLIALMTTLSALILTVKLNPKWLYGWGALCVLFVITDLI